MVNQNRDFSITQNRKSISGFEFRVLSSKFRNFSTAKNAKSRKVFLNFTL